MAMSSGGIGHYNICGAKAGANALGEAGDVPSQIRRDRRERRVSMCRNKAIGIVLNHRKLEAPRDRRDIAPPLIVMVVGFCKVGLR